MALNLSLFVIREILEKQLVDCCDLLEDLRIHQISTDTRSLKPGDLFLALRGENFDGHRFIPQAVAQGAVAIMGEEKVTLADPGVPQLVVSDSLQAYQQIAHGWRKQLTLPVIGVTGSVGKTTTKELMAAVLSLSGKVHKTAANYNNEIGVPKTLLEMTPDHDYAIIEMAMRGPGEIALLAEIAEPTIGVITNVGTAHIGRLGSEEAIAAAKCELLAAMPQTSQAVLNADNELLMATAAKVWSGQCVTYGLERGDIQGQILKGDILQVGKMRFPLPLAGRHNASNYLAALTVAQILGLDWQPLTQGLTVNLPGGRARRYAVSNDILLLDETYNAGLESMLAALQLLKETPGKRRIAVLGAMKELGERSPEFHRRVGERAGQLGLDYLFVLGNDPEAISIAEGAQNLSWQISPTPEDLVQHLQHFLKKGDRVLFKASNSIGLGQVVEGVRQGLTENES